MYVVNSEQMWLRDCTLDRGETHERQPYITIMIFINVTLQRTTKYLLIFVFFYIFIIFDFFLLSMNDEWIIIISKGTLQIKCVVFIVAWKMNESYHCIVIINVQRNVSLTILLKWTFQWMFWKVLSTSRNTSFPFPYSGGFNTKKASANHRVNEWISCLDGLSSVGHWPNMKKTKEKQKNETKRSFNGSVGAFDNKPTKKSLLMRTGDLLKHSTTTKYNNSSVSNRRLLLNITQLHMHFKCALLLIIVKRYF